MKVEISKYVETNPWYITMVVIVSAVFAVFVFNSAKYSSSIISSPVAFTCISTAVFFVLWLYMFFPPSGHPLRFGEGGLQRTIEDGGQVYYEVSKLRKNVLPYFAAVSVLFFVVIAVLGVLTMNNTWWVIPLAMVFGPVLRHLLATFDAREYISRWESKDNKN